jgi:hypothetical protein
MVASGDSRYLADSAGAPSGQLPFTKPAQVLSDCDEKQAFRNVLNTFRE